jgi:lipoprotein-releasing system ATP-binding protein
MDEKREEKESGQWSVVGDQKDRAEGTPTSSARTFSGEAAPQAGTSVPGTSQILPNTTPIVSLEKVVKEYGTKFKTRVLHGVSFSVQPGEFAAIIGPSGSGKSTLLNLIGALDKPTEGTLRIGGETLSGLDDEGLAALRRRYLGFIFQFHYLLPDFTALENVLMPSAIANSTPTKAQREEAKALLERVGLKDKMKNRATDLSGGQQQRVAIARALAGKKPLILADEPTGNLDQENGHEAFQLMREFNAQDGVTFLIVTHDPELANQTDRVISIVDGHIAEDRRTTTV